MINGEDYQSVSIFSLLSYQVFGFTNMYHGFRLKEAIFLYCHHQYWKSIFLLIFLYFVIFV